MVCLVMYSTYTFKVNQIVKNILNVIEYENGHSIEVSIQSEVAFQNYKSRKIYNIYITNMVRTIGSPTIIESSQQYTAPPDYTTSCKFAFLSPYPLNLTPNISPQDLNITLSHPQAPTCHIIPIEHSQPTCWTCP